MKYKDPWIESVVPLEDQILGAIDESGLCRVLLTWSSAPPAHWLVTARLEAKEWDVYDITDRGIEIVTSPQALDEDVKRVASQLAEFNQSFRKRHATQIQTRSDLDDAIAELRMPKRADYGKPGEGDPADADAFTRALMDEESRRKG